MLRFGSGDLCVMHLFACWCFSLLLETDTALPAHSCVPACMQSVRLSRAWRSPEKMRGWVLPGTAGPGFGKRGPSTFLICPPFNSCAASPLACAGPCISDTFDCQKYDRHKIYVTQESKGSVLRGRVCVPASAFGPLRIVFFVFLATCPLLAITAAPRFSVRQQRGQLKRCSLLQGLSKAAKALRVLQGHPVREATELEI